MQKLNVAIVGAAGSMGSGNMLNQKFPFVYSYAEAVLCTPRTQLVALVDTNKEKLAKLVRRLRNRGHTGFRTYSTLEDAIADKENGTIDIACSAVSPAVNAETIKTAVKYGLRGVYVDKPLALNLAEADEIVRLEASSGIKIQTNYLRNFDKCHNAVLEYIRRGELGTLITVRCLYKGGVIGVAPHAVAFLNKLFGMPKWVSAVSSPIMNTRAPADPNVDAILRYHFAEQGRDVNVSLVSTGKGDFPNSTYLFGFEFLGTKGIIKIEEHGWRLVYERMEPSRVFGSIGETVSYRTDNIPPALMADAPRQFMLEGLSDLVSALDGNRLPICNAVVSRNAEEVAHALGLSADGYGLWVELPLVDRNHTFASSVTGIQVLKAENAEK